MKLTIRLVTIIWLLSSIAFTQTDSCKGLNEIKTKAYGFHPTELNQQQQGQKAKVMDSFWDLAGKMKEEGLACVRKMITEEQKDTYFLYDAASLLMQFDKSGKSDTSIADGMLRTDLKDIAADGYIGMAMSLNRRGFDISKIAHKYMHEPNFVAYLPAHGGYKLDRISGAILLYGGMKAEKASPLVAAEMMSNEQDVRDDAAIVLSMILTDKSIQFLYGVKDQPLFTQRAKNAMLATLTYRELKPKLPAKYTREQILQKISIFPETEGNIDDKENNALDNSVYATFQIEDLAALSEGRRKFIRGVSNESIEGYQEISRIMLNLINKLDAYKEYRIHPVK